MTVYTIPFGTPLLPHLARGLLAETAHDPFQLAKYLVLLPTKRGCLNLQQAFFKEAQNRSILLPKIMALSDLEEAPLLPGFMLTDPLPESLNSWQRLSIFTKLIHQYYQQQPHPIDHALAFLQAQTLTTLLDEIETTGIDLERLNTLVGENFASHWQITLEFLKIITEFWPQILAEQQKLDPSHRKRLILEKIAEQWRPDYPVILAGTTGTRPATAQLAKAILGFKYGRIVLPGFDPKTPFPVGPTHPQYTLQCFLDKLEIAHTTVPYWPSIQEESPRAGLLRHLMTPTIPEPWHLSSVPEDHQPPIEMIPCASLEEEAKVIGLITRYYLETLDQEVAIITPDRQLSQRLFTEFQRWQITPDLSSGIPLNQTVIGQFLLLCSAVRLDMPIVDWLTLIKHPLTRKASDRGLHLTLTRQFEHKFLRQQRLTESIWHICLEEGPFSAWYQAILEAATPLLHQHTRQSFTTWIQQHLAVATTLCGSETVLWQGDDGKVAQDFIQTLVTQASSFPDLTHAEYRQILAKLLCEQAVRYAEGIGSRVKILGALEARQNLADVVILAGLNEGTWPKGEQTDPWLNRPMRLELGLPDPQRQIGLAAHDFCLGFSQEHVYLTRALKAQGSSTTPSRWWLRFEALLANNTVPAPSSTRWHHWAKALNHALLQPPLPQPAPCPPITARPTKFSTTDIERLLRDPYAFYAKKILKLTALEPFESDLTMRDWGTRIHQILEQFVKQSDQTFAALVTLGQKIFQNILAEPAVATFWWPRFQQLATWWYHEWNQKKNQRTACFAEIKGSFHIPPYEIHSTADRIDVLANNSYEIIDYKTGEPPTKNHVLQGLYPQLLTEAVILSEGGFTDLPSSSDISLAYWQLTGGKEGGKIKPIALTSDILEEALEGIRNLLCHYQKLETPYLSCPWYGLLPAVPEYAHLARVKEWSLAHGA
jgi:ATP-dependent helicase/nuclease subunit B